MSPRDRVPGDGPKCWCGKEATFGGSCNDHYNTDTGQHTPRPPKTYLIAYDPIKRQPGGPKVQKQYKTGLDEATLRRFFPEETWLNDETYLMSVYRASLEDLEAIGRSTGKAAPETEKRTAFTTQKGETIGIFGDDPSQDVGVEILNTGLIHATLPNPMGWQEAKTWAASILKVAESAEKMGYPKTREEHHNPAKTIEAAFHLVTTMSRQDGGFLQWLLLLCLQTPLSTHKLLVEGLMAIPDALLRQQYPEDPDLKSLVDRMIVLAKKDERFLQNYLDGNPVSEFLPDSV